MVTSEQAAEAKRLIALKEQTTDPQARALLDAAINAAARGKTETKYTYSSGSKQGQAVTVSDVKQYAESKNEPQKISVTVNTKASGKPVSVTTTNLSTGETETNPYFGNIQFGSPVRIVAQKGKPETGVEPFTTTPEEASRIVEERKNQYIEYINKQQNKINPNEQYVIKGSSQQIPGSEVIKRYEEQKQNIISDTTTFQSSISGFELGTKLVQKGNTFDVLPPPIDTTKWAKGQIALFEGADEVISKRTGIPEGVVSGGLNFIFGAVGGIAEQAKTSVRYFSWTGPRLIGVGGVANQPLFSPGEMERSYQKLQTVTFPNVWSEPGKDILDKMGIAGWGGAISMEALEAYGGSKAITKGLGYLKGLGSTGATVSKATGAAIITYTAKSIYEGGQSAYASGDLPRYIGIQSVLLGSAGLGGVRGFKQGETAGFRKRVLSNISTTSEKARIETLYQGMDIARTLPSNAKVFDIATVKKLEGNIAQQESLTRFMQESPYAKKIVLGGSASQSTYGEFRQPVDIDFLIKPGRLTTNLRPFVSNIASTERIIPGYEKFKIYRPSLVEPIKTEMGKYGIDTSLYDIHDLPKIGSSFPQLFTGATERPIRTPEGSLFKYQMRLSEQAGRKIASAYSPLHTLRGKDWMDVMDISNKYFDETLTNELGKYKPELKAGTYELIGKSYYELNPLEAPKSEFTWFENVIHKYGEPLTTKELFSKEGQSFMKADAEAFRPKFVEKPPTIPSWARGVIFYSSPIAIDTKAMKTDYVPIGISNLLPSSYGGIKTTPSEKYTMINYNRYISSVTNYSPFSNVYTPTSYSSSTYTSSYPTPKTYISDYVQSYTPSIYKEQYPVSYTKIYQYPKINIERYTPTYSTPKKYPYYYYNPEKITTIEEPPRKILTIEKTESNIKKHLQGYDVYVKGRRYYKGKKRKPETWIKITKQPLTKEQALGLGGSAVEHSAAASFKIKPTTGIPGKPPIQTESWGSLSNKFYERNGVLIERTAHRINTAGEIKGISALGWIASRQKATYKAPTKLEYIQKVKPIKQTKPIKIDINKMIRGWNYG